MSVNNELKKLYEKYWEQMEINANIIINNTDIKENYPANPFLIKVNEKVYEAANLKVMIFGQETWEWNNENHGASIEEGMNHYENAKERFLGGKNNSVFRKGFDFFKNKIIDHYDDQNIVFIWNNISKIGRYSAKGVTKEIKDLERNFFYVINEEMKILNPDIVIFLTGNRDDDIRFNFPDVTFKKYQNNATLLSRSGKRKFQPAYQVISESKNLPEKSVKVYHPSYFGGFNNIKDDAVELLF